MRETRSRIEALRLARGRTGPGARADRLAALRGLSAARMGAADLRAFRDELLYLAAYPDDPAERRIVIEELRHVAARAASLCGRLVNSGLGGTDVRAPFSLELIDWLRRRFPGHVGVAWEDGSAGSALDELLPLCVAPVERDGLLEGRLTTRQWFELAGGNGAAARPAGADLGWLVDRLRCLPVPPELLDHVLDGLALNISWTLPPDLDLMGFPRPRVFYQTSPLHREVRVAALCRRPVRACAAGREAIDAARICLAARQRETDPVTYAHPGDVTRFDLDRGVTVCLYGLRPERRLPIESFVGYVAARNGVPLAYGGAWIFFEHAEIGINVFESFRGGESAYLFGQILRVYHRHLGVRRFSVDPFQLGEGNRDGIRSGAFWFYYRLGFRPADPRGAELAEAEWALLRAGRGHRSPAAVLRRLARSRPTLQLAPIDEVPDLQRLGLAVTRVAGARFGGDREAAARWAQRRVATRLGAGPAVRRRWPADQRAAFESLCPLVALVDDLEAWPARDRRALCSIMRAKGGTREGDYVARMQAHNRYRTALLRIAALDKGTAVR